MKKRNINFRAFSYVEMSVVIIIVGIMISGVTSGIRLYEESKLKGARTLTENSVVNSMEGLVLWYETSLKKSFSKADAVDQRRVSQWNDINPQGPGLHARAGQNTDNTQNTYNYVSSSGNTSGPTYVEDGINHIPTLSFKQNSMSNFEYLVTDSRMANNPNDSMTMFLVISHNSGFGTPINRSCYDGVGSSSCTAIGKDGIFYPKIHPDGSLNILVEKDDGSDFPSCSYCDSGYDMLPGKSYIITMQRDYGVSFLTYINGSSSYSPDSTSVDDGSSLTMSPFKIGRYDNGIFSSNNFDMSEFIFFSGAITKKEREAVEEYLGKKYNIPISHQ